MLHYYARMPLWPFTLAHTRRFDATDNAPPVHDRCLGQIVVRGEIVHKGQGQAAKAFGILPVTAGAALVARGLSGKPFEGVGDLMNPARAFGF